MAGGEGKGEGKGKEKEGKGQGKEMCTDQVRFVHCFVRPDYWGKNKKTSVPGVNEVGRPLKRFSSFQIISSVCTRN